MNIYKKKLFIYFFLLVTLVILTSNEIRAVGVRPLVIDLEMKPGESKQFQLNLTPENKQQTVQLELYHPKQILSGSLIYKKGTSEQYPALKWVNIKEKKVVPPREKTIVQGTVNVPYEAKGSHTVVVMVEPVMQKSESGISFKVRYAVKININIKRPGFKKRVKESDFNLKTNEKGNPVVSALIKNSSLLHSMVSGEVTIRDKDMRLIQRLQIKSKSARSAGRTATKIYSGSKVRFTGKVTEVLHPGTYNLRLFLTYADGKQEIVSKQVEVGDEFVQEGNVKHIELKPTNINDSLRPGGASTQVLRLRNRTGKQLQIKLGAKEIKPKYKHSIYKNLNVELRGDKKFKIEPRRSGRSVLILRSPRDVKPGGYYGKLNIGVFDKDGNKLSTRNVNIDMLVGEDWKEDVKVQGITSLKDKNEHVFSLSVKNNGDAHFAPQARVYLKDKSGEIIHTLNMSLPKGKNKILPGMSSRLVTRRNDIKPGKYKAEVTIIKDGEELKKAEFEITVKGVKEGEIA